MAGKKPPTFDSPEADDALASFAGPEGDEDEQDWSLGGSEGPSSRASWEQAPRGRVAQDWGSAFAGGRPGSVTSIRIWPDADKHIDARLKVSRRNHITAHHEEVGYLAKDATTDDLAALVKSPGIYFLHPITTTGALLSRQEEPLTVNLAKDHEAFRKLSEMSSPGYPPVQGSMGATVISAPGLPREVTALLERSLAAAYQESAQAKAQASAAMERLVSQNEGLHDTILKSSLDHFTSLAEQREGSMKEAVALHAGLLKDGTALQMEALRAAEAARRVEAEARESASKESIRLQLEFMARERERDMKAQEVQGTAMAAFMQMQMQMQQAQLTLAQQRMDLEREQMKLERERAERDLKERLDREEKRLERERLDREAREERERDREERERQARLDREEREEQRKREHEERLEKLRQEQLQWQREQSKVHSPAGGLSQLMEGVTTVLRITDAVKGIGGADADNEKEEPWWKSLGSIAVQGVQALANARNEQMRTMMQLQAQQQGLLTGPVEDEYGPDDEEEEEEGIVDVVPPNPSQAPVDGRVNVGFSGAAVPPQPPEPRPDVETMRTAREAIKAIVTSLKDLPRPYDEAKVMEILTAEVTNAPVPFYAYCKFKGVKNALEEARATPEMIQAVLRAVQAYNGPGSEYLSTIPLSK